MSTRLLYVDDESDLCDIVENQLVLEGFDVTTASDGARRIRTRISVPPGAGAMSPMMTGCQKLPPAPKARARTTLKCLPWTEPRNGSGGRLR